MRAWDNSHQQKKKMGSSKHRVSKNRSNSRQTIRLRKKKQFCHPLFQFPYHSKTQSISNCFPILKKKQMHDLEPTSLSFKILILTHIEKNQGETKKFLFLTPKYTIKLNTHTHTHTHTHTPKSADL